MYDFYAYLHKYSLTPYGEPASFIDTPHMSQKIQTTTQQVLQAQEDDVGGSTRFLSSNRIEIEISIPI